MTGQPEVSSLEHHLRRKIEEIFLPRQPELLAHTLAVVTRVRERLVNSEFDPLVVMPVAYLHDIGHSLDAGAGRVADMEDPELRTIFHSVLGAEEARRILREMGVPSEITEQVAHLISVHHHDWIDDPIQKFFREADRVGNLEPVG